MKNQLTEQQRQDAYHLMEILGIEPEYANELLASSNFNIQTAINIHINNFTSITPRPPPHVINIDEPQDFEHQPFQQTHSSYIKFRGKNQFQAKKSDRGIQEFKKTYLIKKMQKLKQKKRGGPKREKGNMEGARLSEGKMRQQYNFLDELEKVLQGKSMIEYHDDLYDVFNQMLKTKKLVALHCLILVAREKGQEQKDSFEQIKQLYGNKQFVQNVNKAFINYGLQPSRFDFGHYPFMNDFLSPQLDQPSIVLLRLNHVTHKVEIFRKLRIQQVFKISQSAGFKKIITNLNRQSNLIAFNNSETKTLTQEEKIKIKQDRLIRAQQQQQYLENFKQQSGVCSSQAAPVKREAIQETRARIRSTLKQYDQYPNDSKIQFRIRVPNSVIIHLTLPHSETVQYLFKFIESYQLADIGFENEPARYFEILQPQERLYLSERKQQSIKNVFGESQMETLVVKQL